MMFTPTIEKLARQLAVEHMPTQSPLAPAKNADSPEALMALESMLNCISEIERTDALTFLQKAERRLAWAIYEASTSTSQTTPVEIERRIFAARGSIAKFAAFTNSNIEI